MKNKNLHKIKSTGFKAPDGYFSSFDDNVFNKIDSENSLNTIKNTGFKVPKGYFESLNANVLFNQIEKRESKIISLFNKKNLLYLSGVAAAILLLFNLSLFSKNPSFDNLESDIVENYLIDEYFSTNDDIAALFTDDEIEQSVSIDYDINASNIEEYLLNNADIESLLLE
jgi:hypothetical protein